MKPTSLFVRATSGGADYEVCNPARPHEVVGLAPQSSLARLDEAISAARAARKGWVALGLDRRVAAVGLAAEAVVAAAAADDLASTYTRENGKVLSEARAELQAPSLLVQVFAGLAPGALADEAVDPAGRIRIHRCPRGVVAVILPFNAPVVLGFMKVIPALLAGNTVVVKPPPTSPLTTLAALAAFAEALPPGVLLAVNGQDRELSEALVAHEGVDSVSFTGSVGAGRAVMAAAARRNAHVVLELGGNDAAIVAPDVEVSDIAAQLLAGALRNSGQICMAIKRLYVPEESVAKVVEGLRDAGAAFRTGDGLRSGVTHGPVHTSSAAHRLRDLVAGAKARGASVQQLGDVDQDDVAAGGWFVPPVVLHGVDPLAPVVVEEQFGPVLPIVGYRTVDDAVRMANATPFGLSASVWSNDAVTVERLSSQLEVGTVYVNGHGTAANDFRAPFGGWKSSGLGREAGAAGLHELTQPRTVIHALPAPPVAQPPSVSAGRATAVEERR